ncbi:MAG: DUF3857 domain-containing protein [Algoriphagus sp.]|uniref:DUF3857 domain-containing protein n=1 Tax=Algoriphagus sp. TaxID=1872435 RepID=UPI002636769E|nr:DUF3857 domain-containing protein [Algoriphagus sp.]MDG1276230.1 DUF3857 domain-containing protein [Algoriphagus sp.]
MNKRIILCFLSVISFGVLAQTPKFGKANSNEINLTSVSFEPDADAVFLLKNGESRFFGNVFETAHFGRMKILAEEGKSYADLRIRYYSGEKRIEEISGIKAQTINYVDGKAEVTEVPKESIFDVSLDNGYREVRITFPKVQVGSILEYTYKETDKSITFIDGWTFQNNIPTLYSHYQITMTAGLQYRMLSQGENLLNKGEKTESNGTYSWTLRNLYAFQEEPYMKNYRDYFDRVEFQLSKYAQGSEWEDVLSTWPALGDELIGYYREKGYYRSNPLEKELLAIELTGNNQTEIAQKVYYYLRDNFVIDGDDWIYPEQVLNQLLKSKKGTPAELMLTYMGILNSAGIECDPVLIGSKGYGRTDLVDFPFLNQFDEILLLAKLDGKFQYLDLSDRLAPFGYVDLEKHVKEGLHLQKETSKIVPVMINHNSNTIYFAQTEYNPEKGLSIKNSIRENFYMGLQTAHHIERLQSRNESLELFFDKDESDEMIIQNVTVENNLREKNFVTVSFETVLPNSENLDLIIFNPLRFSTFAKNPFTASYRVFPVDFQFAFNETYNTNVIIPEGYEVEDYPLAEQISIKGGYVTFTYAPTKVDGMLKITARLEVKKPLIPVASYGDLKFFMESVASKLTAPVVLKKIANP